MPIESPIVLESADGDLAEGIAALPTTAGVLCLVVNGRVTYLSSAPNLQRRVGRVVTKLTGPNSGQIPGSNPGFAMQVWESRSKLQTSLLLYQLAKLHFPEEYLQRVHLRMPWFVALLTRDAFPRLISTNRIPQGCEPIIGPFARRETAQLYEQEVQSAFLLRRCTEVLDPHLEHPGCIYGEMKQCLRPCQMAVDPERYLLEATEVCSFLSENGNKAVRELTKARDQAMNALDFEGAARVHKQLEKLKTAKAARDPVVVNVGTFSGVALVREGTSAHVQLFPMMQGRWGDPLSLDATKETLETTLRERFVSSRFEQENSNRDTLEDLALFARWYYSSWREGVWLPISKVDDPPYRKIVRNLRKLVKNASVDEMEAMGKVV